VTAGGVVTAVRPRMGTLLAVSAPAAAPGAPLVAEPVFAIARRCEGLMNRHDPTSALSRLNASAGTAAGLADAELTGVLRAARRLTRRLEGAFDPTVGSLIDLWRRSAARGAVPNSRSIARTLAGTGPVALAITGATVSLPRAGTSIDLDGVAKGLALDRIAAALRAGRCGSAFLNFGESSLVAIGRPPRGRWSVTLRNPFGGFAGEFTLRDRACSTSSTFARRLRVRARATGDIIDPRTGRPVTRDAQVTVVAASAAVAEAVSTALLVLGPDAVDRIARRFCVDVCWIDRSGVRTTPWFALRRAA
jgi:thiamine biosynthesis lipoprotein